MLTYIDDLPAEFTAEIQKRGLKFDLMHSEVAYKVDGVTHDLAPLGTFITTSYNGYVTAMICADLLKRGVATAKVGSSTVEFSFTQLVFTNEPGQPYDTAAFDI